MVDNLKYVLQPGGIIFTQCFSNDEWLPNVIKSIHENIIEMNLNDYYFRQGVMVGDFISIRFSYSENEYVLDGQVTDIDIYNEYSITVFVNNINIYKNRRHQYRYYAKLGANLRVSSSEKGTYSIVTNISLSGVGIISKANINVGSPVLLDLFLSSKNIIPVKGSIMRKKALNYGYEYGIVVSGIDIGIQEKLKELLDKLETNVRHM